MKILLAGGGSGGPVAPLLAIAQKIRTDHPKAKFLFVGTNQGPAREMAESIRIQFITISAGKWRRYYSLKNVLTFFQVSAGFFQSLKIIKSFQPDCVVGAGGFVQVPLVWAAFLHKIPCLIHQQDILPGFANKLCQLPASKITVSFEQTAKKFISQLGFFYKKQRSHKVVFTGNPVRSNLKQVKKEEAVKFFGLHDSLPVLYVVGGGTGSSFFNSLISESMPYLAKVIQILHVTGQRQAKEIKHENYRAFSFISRADLAYGAADVVLCRAGLSTLSELSYLKKIAIIVPMPNSHQELNALYLYQQKAAVVLSQENLNPENLPKLIKKILFDIELQKKLKTNIGKLMPHNSDEKIAELVIKLALEHATKH